MSGYNRTHYAGTYKARALAVRQAAQRNPYTLCARCGQRLDQPPHKPGDTWDAGHQRDGDPTSPLQPEASSCNRSAGATTGNRRRKGLTPTRDW